MTDLPGLFKIRSSYKPTAEIETFIGDPGDLFYDVNTSQLRISDGETPGGVAVGGSGGTGDYTLPTATTTVKGGVKVDGTTITISNQVISGFSGSYTDLTNKPTLFNGAYDSLSGKPTLFSGSYADLTNKPTLFSGSYTDLTNKPVIPSLTGYATETFVTSQGYLTSVGTISYNDLSNKPTLFSGSYTDLSNKPTIPTNTNQLTNGAGFITGYTETDPVFVAHASYNITSTQITNWDTAYGWGDHAGAGYLTSVGTISYNDLSDKPTLFSGSYTDLTNKPTIPNNVSQLVNDSGYITASAIPAQFTFNVAADDSTQRTVGTQETVKFIGAGGITTASDAEGNITITQGSSSSVFSNQYSLTTTTSNATETELLVNGSTRIPVSTNTSINYIINIAARRTDTAGDYAMFEIRGVAANVAGTVTDIGSVYEVVVARTNAGYLVDARADDTNNSVNVYVTGVSGHTINWKAVAQTIEV